MKRNEAMKELNKELRKLNEFLRLWKEVKRVTKKGGGDYANLSKNFEGVKITRSDINNSWIEIRVNTYLDGLGYMFDEEVIYHYPGKEQGAVVTADMVEEKIERIINDREKQVEEIEEDIQMFDSINEELRQAYTLAVSAREKAKSYKLTELIDSNHAEKIYLMKYEFDNRSGLE